jgi:hypothetical protein
MEEFDLETAMMRSKKTWPWTLRQEIKELVEDFLTATSKKDDIEWTLSGRNWIQKRQNNNCVITADLSFKNRKIEKPVEIKLTIREWWYFRKAIKLVRKKVEFIRLEKLSKTIRGV